MNATTHKIEKVLVEINTGSLESATYIKNNMGRFLETEVFPKLEEALNEFDQTGRVARIDSLNLKIATLRDDYFNREVFFKTLESEIVKQFVAEIQSEIGFSELKINKQNINEKVIIIPTDKNRTKVFLFFLENGYLPWFGTENDIAEILKPEIWQKTLADPLFITRVKEILKQHKLVYERFFYQLDYKSITAFLLKISPELKKTEQDILLLTQSLPRKLHLLFLRFLFFAATGYETQVLVQTVQQFSSLLENSIWSLFSKSSVGFNKRPVSSSSKNRIHRQYDEQILRLQELLTGFFRKTELFTKEEKRIFTEIVLTPFKKDLLEISDLKATESNILDDPLIVNIREQELFFKKNEGEIAVQSAGLVLLHPFLKSFFKNLKLLDEHGNITVARRHLAVQIVHYLATGEEDFFESNLVFCKFLCGVPLEIPVPRESLLTKSGKNETNQLLKEVIKHWSALKNTSPDGLRQMFLQRSGKLIQKDRNFKLIVERKAQDVLIEKLKWNISVIKLPWKRDLMVVEW